MVEICVEQIGSEMIRLLLFAALVVIAAVQTNLAYGHFFGTTQNVDKYQVVFAPYPAAPVAGSNSTLLKTTEQE